MDNVILKEFVLKEFKKKIPQETARDEKKVKEFISRNINEPLVDKLVAEFCEMNPMDFAVLNTFKLSDEKLKEIKENIETAIADGTIERIKYEQVVNHAGLAYLINKSAEYDAEINNAVRNAIGKK
jgi:hypothetical protein